MWPCIDEEPVTRDKKPKTANADQHAKSPEEAECDKRLAHAPDFTSPPSSTSEKPRSYVEIERILDRRMIARCAAA